MWDVAAAQEAFALPGHEGSIRALALGLDGRTLASGGADRTIKIWDLVQRVETHSFRGHDGSVRALLFSCDGVLASASDDATVKLWNLTTGTVRLTLEGHTRGVSALAFSAGGTTLVSAGQDATVRVWDPATGQTRGLLKGHKDTVTALTIHPHGLNLVSASHDTMLLRWQAGKFQAPKKTATAQLERAADSAAPNVQPDQKAPSIPGAAAPEIDSRAWLIAGLLVGIILTLCFTIAVGVRHRLQQRRNAGSPVEEELPVV